jgi:hypothetical protein
MLMDECVSPYSMHLVMTPWAMNLVQSGGAQFRVLRKYYYQLSACWQVQVARDSFIENVFQSVNSME